MDSGYGCADRLFTKILFSTNSEKLERYINETLKSHPSAILMNLIPTTQSYFNKDNNCQSSVMVTYLIFKSG